MRALRGVITEYVFIELNSTEKISFPLYQDRQEMPEAENSLYRVAEHHDMIRTLPTLICLKCREEGKLNTDKSEKI